MSQSKSAPQQSHQSSSERGSSWEVVTSVGRKVSGSSIVTDRTNGDTYLFQWGSGVSKSTDGGLTFTRVDDGKIGSAGCGPHTGYSAQISPDGNKLAVFNMWNEKGPSGYSMDSGASWQQFGHASRDRDWEFGAMDWDTGTVLAVAHESNNGLYLSNDMGSTWVELDKSGGNQDCHRPVILGVGALGKEALLVGHQDRIERSEDGGNTWSKVSDFSATGKAIQFDGKVWWLTRPLPTHEYFGYYSPEQQSVIVSEDEGRTWSAVGTALPERTNGVWFGPLFGEDSNHIVVVGGRGFYETTDGCESWELVAELPSGYDLTWIWRGASWDPIRNIFYIYNLGKELMKYQR